MSALSIEKAIRLYHMLEYFLPTDTSPEDTVMQFVSKIVYNIKTTNQHRVYVEALALMQETTVENIIATYTPEESLQEFYTGLKENQILTLKEFCTRVGI
jgi:hypothetical protein